MKIIKFKKLDKRGDTIVEVLIALAVLSLSLGISYAAANNGLNQSLNAQEHSQALGIIDAQIEQLRSAIDGNIAGIPDSSSSQFFCMIPSSPFVVTSFSGNVPSSSATDSSQGYSEYPGSCLQGATKLFHVSISSQGSSYNYTTPSTSPETNYTVVVRWDGIGNLGPQQESLNYRLGAEGSGNYADPVTVTPPLPPPPPVTVDGADYLSCTPYANGQSTVDSSCHPASPASTGSVYSLSDYKVIYSLAAVPAGSYSVSIVYENFDDGPWPPPLTGNFKYNVQADINSGNVLSTDLNLPISGAQRSVGTVTLPANSTLTLNWQNNQWIGPFGNGEGIYNNNPVPGSYDPNLQIDSIIFTPN